MACTVGPVTFIDRAIHLDESCLLSGVLDACGGTEATGARLRLCSLEVGEDKGREDQRFHHVGHLVETRGGPRGAENIQVELISPTFLQMLQSKY